MTPVKIPDEILNVFWGKVILFINRNELWDYMTWIIIALVAIYGVSMTVTWRLARRKDRLEIFKLTAERTKSQIENLQHLHKVEEDYQSKQEMLNLYFNLLVEALLQNKSIKEVHDLREELINHFSSSFLSSFDKYIDIYSTVKTRKECQIFYKIHINDMFDTIEKIFEVINDPNLTKSANLSPFILSKNSFMGIELYFSKVFPPYRLILKAQMRKRVTVINGLGST